MTELYKPSAGEHPITPPPELVQRLSNSPDNWLHQITNAYQAGADMELEACCEWLDHNSPSIGAFHLRIDRRPKPPSLKEQALAALSVIEENTMLGPEEKLIRRALEALDD